MESESDWVVYDSLRPHGLCLWNSLARILEWVAFPFSRGSSQARDGTQVSRIVGGLFFFFVGGLLTSWEPQRKPKNTGVTYPFSSGSSWPRNWTGVSCIAGGFFTNWAVREAWCGIQTLFFHTLCMKCIIV